MKVLVTGATGFLGAHLVCELLQRGQEVRALRRNNSSMKEFRLIAGFRLGEHIHLMETVEWVEGDILDYSSLLEAMNGIDTVYHCAAIVSFWPTRRENMYRTNVEGTAQVVNACLESGVPHLIYSSSIAAIGRNGKEKEITEETPWTSSTHNSNYAISKYLAEMEVWRGQEEGLRIAIVNPGVILGEGDPEKGSCRFLEQALQGMKVYTKGQNGYVDVLDVVRCMAELRSREIYGERFILVGENMPVKQLLSLAAQMNGKPAPTIGVGAFAAGIAWRFLWLKSKFDGREPLITKETARTALSSNRYSSRKIENILNIGLTSVNETLIRVNKRR